MPPSPEQELARSRYAAAEAEYLLTFPDVDDLMPTRFGNVIKAFENYSKRVYGLEGTAGWTRLVAVIPSSYGAVINDARSEVDFCVNLCALSVFVSLLSLVRFALSASGVALEGPTITFLLGSLASLVVANAAYRGAVERAGAWGDTVKAAFDLYLPAMAKQLGYELPATLELRAEFWDCVNGQMLLHIPINPAEWRPLDSAPAEAPGSRGEEQGGGGCADDDKEDLDGGEEPEDNGDDDGDAPSDLAQPGVGQPR